MKQSSFFLITGRALFAGAVILSAGCSSPARRVDPGGTELITTVTRLDEQDAADAAVELAQSLLDADVLGQAGKPSVLAIDQFINTSGVAIDKDRILKKIRVVLSRAGVAQVMTVIGQDGEIGGESLIASKAAGQRLKDDQIDAFLNDTPAPEALYPEYSLTFKIMRTSSTSVSLLHQVAYTFQMSLTDVRTGLAVWEEEKQVTKQGRWPSAGN
jgi:PBP1b-binding outer membrane lipoprotein LpoB